MRVNRSWLAPFVILSIGLVTSAHAQRVQLRLAPDVGLVSSYTMTNDMFVESAMMPMASPDMPMVHQSIQMTQKVTAANGNTREIEVILDSVSMEMPMMGGQMPGMPNLNGTRSVMTMDTRGTVLSTEVTGDSLPAMVREVAGQMSNGMAGIGFNFPEDPVRPGESWDASQDFTIPGGGASGSREVTTTLDAEYRLERVENNGGAQHAVIAFEGVLAQTTMSNPMMGEMGISGTMSGEMTVDLDRGRLVNSAMKMVMDGTLQTGGEANTFKMTMDMKMELAK